MKLAALQFKVKKNFNKNLQKITSLINKVDENSIILAPELCLTGFSYDKMKEASKFSKYAIEIIRLLSKNKIIALTVITTNKKNTKYYNELFLISNKSIIHKQSKSKLFKLGNENKHFKSGKKNDIKIINVNGLKIGTLICFELRFTVLWELVKGADIILIPAMWGKTRKQNFISLTNALAIMNQSYVIASCSSCDNMASSSGIITPFGKDFRDDNKKIIESNFDMKQITIYRKYIDVDII